MSLEKQFLHRLTPPTLRRSALLLIAALGTLSLGSCAESPRRSNIELEESGSPFIAFDIWVKAGSQDDPAGKEGLAALTALMISDGGSQDDTYEAILEQLYPMAASYSSSVDKEMSTFRGVVHRDNLTGYYRLLKNAVIKPAFAATDFERLHRQTLDFLERGRRFQRDEELSKELLVWRTYRDTPYEHPEEGYVSSVRALTLDDVKAFYASHYTRERLEVAVGGGLPPGFAAAVQNDFDALASGTAPQIGPSTAHSIAGTHVVIVEKDTDATAISIGFPLGVRRGEPDFPALELVGTWLGLHRSSFSRLYQVIREQRGMNYGDYAYVEAFPLGYTTMERPINVARRSQMFEIWIRPVSLTAPDDLHDRALFATRAALRELDSLVAGGLPEAQVLRTKAFLEDYSVTYGSTLLRRLAFAVDDRFYGISAPGYLAGARAAFEGLDTATVNAAIRRRLDVPGRVIVFITRDALGLKQKLLSGQPTPIRYPGQVQAEILAEDREIASYPLEVEEQNIEILDILQVFEGKGR